MLCFFGVVVFCLLLVPFFLLFFWSGFSCFFFVLFIWPHFRISCFLVFRCADFLFSCFLLKKTANQRMEKRRKRANFGTAGQKTFETRTDQERKQPYPSICHGRGPEDRNHEQQSTKNVENTIGTTSTLQSCHLPQAEPTKCDPRLLKRWHFRGSAWGKWPAENGAQRQGFAWACGQKRTAPQARHVHHLCEHVNQGIPAELNVTATTVTMSESQV